MTMKRKRWHSMRSMNSTISSRKGVGFGNQNRQSAQWSRRKSIPTPFPVLRPLQPETTSALRTSRSVSMVTKGAWRTQKAASRPLRVRWESPLTPRGRSFRSPMGSSTGTHESRNSWATSAIATVRCRSTPLPLHLPPRHPRQSIRCDGALDSPSGFSW